MFILKLSNFSIIQKMKLNILINRIRRCFSTIWIWNLYCWFSKGYRVILYSDYSTMHQYKTFMAYSERDLYSKTALECFKFLGTRFA